MTFILDLIRTPAIVCVLSAVVGVGLGLGYGAQRRVSAAVPVLAALAAGVLVGALAPQATLSTPLLALGFIVTTIVTSTTPRRAEQQRENV